MSALRLLMGDALADFERAWPNRQRHVVAHGVSERLPELFEDDRIATWEALIDAHRGMLCAQGNNALGQFVVQSSIDAETAKSLLRFGVPIQLYDAEMTFPVLGTVVDELCDELGVPMANRVAMIFVSPPGRGVPRHYDDRDVWVVGLRGTKTFWVAPNHDVPNVTRGSIQSDAANNATVDRAPNMPAGAQRVDVGPGDCLFLPRGIWHESASGGEACWSITIGMRRPTTIEFCLDALRAALTMDPELRAPLPGLTDDARGATLALVAANLNQLKTLLPTLTAEDVLATEAKVRLLREHSVARGMTLAAEGETVHVLASGETIAELDAPPSLRPVVARLTTGNSSVSLGELAREFPDISLDLLTDFFEGLRSTGFLVASSSR